MKIMMMMMMMISINTLQLFGLQHQLGYLATHYRTGSSSKSILSSVMSCYSHPDILLFILDNP